MKNYSYRLMKRNIHGQKQYKCKGLALMEFNSSEEASQYINDNKEKMAEYTIEKIDIDKEKERGKNELYRIIRI